MTELVRVGLRNPARVVVKVQAKKAQGKVIVEERRIPAKYALQHFSALYLLSSFQLSLQNYYISCYASEKLLQLTRIIAFETSQRQSSNLIIYFSTCACVNYFYKVGVHYALLQPHSQQGRGIRFYPVSHHRQSHFIHSMATYHPLHEPVPSIILLLQVLYRHIPLSSSLLMSPPVGSIFQTWMSLFNSTPHLTPRLSHIAVVEQLELDGVVVPMSSLLDVRSSL